MAGTKAERLKTSDSLTGRNTSTGRELHALNRFRIVPKVIQPPSLGQGAIAVSGQSTGASGNFLQPQGDTMIGPIAFSPVEALIDIIDDPANPSINITEGTEDYSTYVKAFGSGIDDTIQTIYGATFDGQLLYLQSTSSSSLTLVNATGNIITNTGGNLLVSQNEIITLIFDPDIVTDGAWVVVSAGGGGEEEAVAILGLIDDQLIDGVIDFDENFIFGDQSKIIDRTADEAGVFQIVGAVANLDSFGSIEGDIGGQGSSFLLEWESSANVNGPFTPIPNPQARFGVLNAGRAAFTTQPHAVALVDARTADLFVRLVIVTVSGSLVAILNGTSGANIQTIGGAGAGGGGGGVTNLNELTDVTINPNPPVVDGLILTWVAASQQWEAQAGSGGGANTFLSNLTAPTNINEDLILNSHDLLKAKRLLFDVGDGAFPDPSTDTGVTTDASKDLLWNIPSARFYDWKHNNKISMRLSEESNDMVFIVQSHNDGGIPKIQTISADPTPTVGTSIFNMSMFARNDNVSPSVISDYANITVDIEDLTEGLEDGSLHLGPTVGGLPRKYISMNDSNDNNVTIQRNLTLGFGFHILLGTTLNPGDSRIYMADDTPTTNAFISGSTANVGFFIGNTTVARGSFGTTRLTLTNDYFLQTQQVEHRDVVVDPTSPNPLDGAIWYISSTGKLRGREGGVNKDLISAGGTTDLVGTIEEALWTTGETDEFDFFVWHSNSNNNGAISTVNLVEDLMVYVPIFIGKTVDSFRVGIRVNSSPGGVYNLAFGIYSNRTDGQNYPSTIEIQDNTSFSGAGIKSMLLTATLDPGLHWLAVVSTSENIPGIDGYDAGDCQSVGWQEDGTDFKPITGYLASQSSPSLPTNPPDGMTPILELFGVTPAIYARFIP